MQYKCRSTNVDPRAASSIQDTKFSFVCPFVAEKDATKCHIWMDGWMDVAPWYYKWMDGMDLRMG